MLAQAATGAEGIFDVFNRVFVICSGEMLSMDVTGSEVQTRRSGR